MNDEQISALVDGELPLEETAPVLDALSGDLAGRSRWGRYHLIGEAMRANRSAPTAIVALPPRRHAPRPLAGLAIAACAALVALVFALRPTPPPAGVETAATPTLAAVETLPLAAVEPSASAPDGAARATDETSPQVVGPAVDYEQRLNGYLVNFNEQRSRLGVPGVHPYVRIVGFESE